MGHLGGKEVGRVTETEDKHKFVHNNLLKLKPQTQSNSVILGDFSTLISLIDKNKTELLFELSET